MRPLVTGRRPEMVFSVVDLALVDGEGHALEGLDLAVVDVDVLDLKEHRW
jgi:hypothetical protein